MLRHQLRGAAVLAVALLLAAGCSSSKVVQGGTATDAASTVAGAATSTIVVASSQLPTSVVPTSDPAATTTIAAATTTTALGPPEGGWTLVDASTAPGPLAYPCCASNWSGVPSPPLPAAGTALPDGVYAIEFDWPTDFSTPTTAAVSRFEQCSVLPAGACEDNGGGVYADDELGTDDTATYQLPLTFDDQLHVLLGGFAGNDTPGFATANGLDLAALVTALDADYQVAILQPYLAGATQDEITATLTAAPAHGFGAPADPFAGALVYTHDGAPPLLFQGLVGFDDTPDDTRGSDIIGRIALVVSGGELTINLYAGFYS